MEQPALLLYGYVISTNVMRRNLFLHYNIRAPSSLRSAGMTKQGWTVLLRQRCNSLHYLFLSKFMNSSRVLAWLNAPQKSDVVVMEFCFLTPRICMHMCCASTTTITPSGLRVFWIHSFICSVSLSCTCRRRE